MVSLVPWVCRYQKKSLMPTAYCLTTNLLSNTPCEGSGPLFRLNDQIFGNTPECIFVFNI
jgi:hypothetical protein